MDGPRVPAAPWPSWCSPGLGWWGPRSCVPTAGTPSWACSCSAVLTPPDVVSQVMVAGPLMLLYEGSILLSARTLRRMERAEQQLRA